MEVMLFFAVAFVSGNNISACVGTAVGAGVIKKNLGISIGIAGFITGLLVQGKDMIPAAAALFPNHTLTMAIEALGVTLAIFLFGNLVKVPLSLTMALVGLIVGISLSHHAPFEEGYAFRVIAMWFLAPVVAIAFSFSGSRFMQSARPRMIWRRVFIYKLSLFVLSFLASYVLGANTIAMLVAVSGFNTFDLAISLIALIFGSIFFSTGAMKRIGRDIFSLKYSNALVAITGSVLLVEAATLFGVPLSNTQTLSAGVFGSGLSYRSRYISIRPFAIIVAGWLIAPMLSFLIGYLL